MKKIFVFFLIVMIFSGIIFIRNNPFCYNMDYWGDIGIKKSHLYSDIIIKKGQPQEIKHINNETIVSYGNVQFIWYNTDLHGTFIRAEIIDDSITIGEKNICIGSGIAEVKDAYSSVFIQEIKDLPQNCIGYFDKGVCVIYFFDESNSVEKITLSYSI